MMYYRVAIRLHASPNWHWKSTVLSSLEALFRLLRLFMLFRKIAFWYAPFPHVRN
jgi:hypothetical protein